MRTKKMNIVKRSAGFKYGNKKNKLSNLTRSVFSGLLISFGLLLGGQSQVFAANSYACGTYGAGSFQGNCPAVKTVPQPSTPTITAPETPTTTPTTTETTPITAPITATVNPFTQDTVKAANNRLWLLIPSILAFLIGLLLLLLLLAKRRKDKKNNLSSPSSYA